MQDMQDAEMRRNVIPEQSPEQFPLSIKKGHATVKIYEVRNRDRLNYTVTYVTGSGRKRKTFANLELARREAHTIAANLAAGDLEALKLSGADKQIYVEAQRAIAQTNLPLHSVAHEFARASSILGHAGIVDAARYYKKHVEADLPQVSVAEAVEKFRAAKEAEGVSTSYLKDIRIILGDFVSHFHCPLSSVQPDDLRQYLNAMRVGLVTKANRRRLLVVLFNFARDNRWLRLNEKTAAEALGTYKPKPRDVEIYTPGDVAKLLASAELLDAAREPHFMPYLTLIAFGGIRREELHKDRRRERSHRDGLLWESINFDQCHIIVPAGVAKTKRKRKITMQENLREWLSPYRGKSGPIFNIDPRKRMARVSALSGVKWKRNGLRHSFGSYRLEQTKNAGQVALEMGNSAGIVMKHYYEVVDAKAAREYWALQPLSKKSRKIIRFGPR
jgi:hypothetical protein